MPSVFSPLLPMYPFGGPNGKPGNTIGSNPRGGYVFKVDTGPYVLCIMVVDIKASAPVELREKGIGKGSYLICELGASWREAKEELAELTALDIQMMAEATVGPWARWV